MNPPHITSRPSPSKKIWRQLRNASVITAFIGLLLAFTPAAALAQETNYVALGDSYASGTGTRAYIDDGSGCERSTHAHPYLYANHIGANLDFQACAGARIPNVRNSQLAALGPDTDLITISVGGNDTGWVDVLISCGTPFSGPCWDDIAQAERYIQEELPAELNGLYADINTAAPNANVYVTGYPRLFNGERCNWLVDLSYEEQMALNDAADLLNSVIASAAAGAGFGFIDVTGAFTGHAVCDDPEYLNGLSWPLGESFHPNTLGHSQGYLPLLP
ncbi:SGNH/GDSL hydrolase family protein [Natronoglycomyces albus]|uniref:SGNH/GDSL hydrolase family protein n=1 Tax=Natronoglycomyces albus TaxID=2811108 RepID=A0A895XR16_9ACTN|nr:SGNH/GDSL hydrolase family protein [Natronoglycomyces albus]QSB05963.1 SGNH/GDSL hydrolase family protein [Natronoglycomyces albus]